MIKGKPMEGLEFVHTKHEIQLMMQVKASNNIIGCNSFIIHKNNEENGSPLNLEINHKCNESI
jgi:hypothetical protein